MDENEVMKWALGVFGSIVILFIGTLTYIYRRDRTEYKEDQKKKDIIIHELNQTTQQLAIIIERHDVEIDHLKDYTFKKK